MEFNSWPFRQIGRLVALTMVIGAFALNQFIQAFCQPVLYAKLMLVFFIVSFFFLPKIEKKLLINFALFFCGTGIPICMYCIYFLFKGQDGENATIVLFLPFPITGMLFVPFLILVYLCFIPFELKGLSENLFFYSGIIAPFVVLVIFISVLNTSYKKINEYRNQGELKNNVEALYKIVPKNYFMERVLGRHWKYHTRICWIYDGRRPPFHDPIFNVAYDYLDSEPSVLPGYGRENYELYKKLFPEQPLNEHCSCAPW